MIRSPARGWLLPAFGAVAALLLTRCDGAGEACEPACSSGYVCDDGACVPDDAGCDPACSVGYVCQAGACLPSSGGPPAGEIGASCARNADCAEGVCFASSFPGGYCSRPCGGRVLNGTPDCAAGAACVQLAEAAAACMDVCGSADTGGCRPNYACKALEDGSSICYPGCEAATDCPPQTGCNVTTGLCEAQLAGPGRVGAPCAAPADCDSGLCLSEADSGGMFPGGFCLRACDQAQVNAFCTGNDGICLGLQMSAGQQTYVCLPICTTGVDCRQGYMCSADFAVTTDLGYGVCFPKCTTTGCKAGWACDASVGACQPDSGPAPTSVDTQGLGSVSVGPDTSLVKSVAVTVTSGVASFTLVADPALFGTAVILSRLTAPNGEVLYDFFDPLKTAFKDATVFGGPKAFLYPNSPRLNLLPGTYTFELASDPSDTVALNVLTKQGSGLLQSGTLEVSFWFTNTGLVTAAGAPTHPQFQQALQIVREIYAGVGIQVGTPRYHDVAGAQAQALAVIDDQTELLQLFTLADTTNDGGIHFFVIDHFNFDNSGGGGLLGISGGLPGPPSVPGLPHGGVAVALAYMQPAGLFAETVAHEAGHFLGLFHTSERDGLSFDPLPDTVECPASHDANHDGLIVGSECTTAGHLNLMFWTTAAGGAPQRELTPDQRFVLLRNPAIE